MWNISQLFVYGHMLCIISLRFECNSFSFKHISLKVVSEYDQEIPQITNRRQPRDSRSTITRHQEDKLSKATNSLFPIKMIAILEWTYSNVQQIIKHRTITDSHNGSNNKQKVNNNRITALERTAA